MPAYKFEALDEAGKAQSGLLEADNAKAARAQLRSRQLVPLAVNPVGVAANDATGHGRPAANSRPDEPDDAPDH